MLMKQRAEKDIWYNLFDFPLIELNPGIDLNKEHLIAYFGIKIKSFTKVHETKHKLTHQELSLYFYEAFFDHIPRGFLDVSFDELNKYAVPKPIENFLKSIVQLPE